MKLKSGFQIIFGGGVAGRIESPARLSSGRAAGTAARISTGISTGVADCATARWHIFAQLSASGDGASCFAPISWPESAFIAISSQWPAAATPGSACAGSQPATPCKARTMPSKSVRTTLRTMPCCSSSVRSRKRRARRRATKQQKRSAQKCSDQSQFAIISSSSWAPLPDRLSQLSSVRPGRPAQRRPAIARVSGSAGNNRSE